ncbi:1693_t:CDS:1, partial [Dentiscutata heterogama]
MQAALAPQINYNPSNWELNLVAYSYFLGGNQNPMTWLNDVEKAFVANLVTNDCHIPVIIPYLKDATAMWWATTQHPPNPIDTWDNPAQANTSFHSYFILQF